MFRNDRLVRYVLPAFVSGILGLAGPARATVFIDVTESGGNVVFSVTGVLNLTGAIRDPGDPDDENYQIGLIPGGNNWYIAPGKNVFPPPNNGGPVDFYRLTNFQVPFGTSTTFFSSPSSSSGDAFSIWGDKGGDPVVGVPHGYTSGGAIASTMIFSGSFADFTLIPGVYYFNIPSDTVVVRIGTRPCKADGTTEDVGSSQKE